MAALESLPPDQRAVLQLVLQRGRSYDEIAAMLSIDRAAVRDRALSAFDALGPPTRVSADRRALITDYLMGQLPPRVAEQIFDRLAQSPAERAWARALASELASLSRSDLPEIPTSAERPVPAPAPPAEPAAPVVPEPAAQEPAPSARPRRTRPAKPAGPPVVPAFSEAQDDDASYGRRDTAADAGGDRGAAPPPSSRRGGAILLGGLVVAIVAIVVAILVFNNGGSSSSSSGSPAAHTSPTTPTGAASTPTSATSSGATTTPGSASGAPAGAGTSGASGTTGPQLVEQLDLKSPSGAKSPVGVAQVVREGKQQGIVIVATGVTPNTKHNAYAVWLDNSSSEAVLLGFVNPAVGSTGRLQTAGVLPTNASKYHNVLVTLETQPKPAAPGQVILRGALTLK